MATLRPTIYALKDSTYSKTDIIDDDSFESEIGDSKTLDGFYPQYKLKRWDNEVNFSARIRGSGMVSPTMDGDKIVYTTPEYTARFYDTTDGFEFDITQHVKPASRMVAFTLRHKGLKFYYQPPLTQEQIDKGYERPDDIVGSYAVFHESRRNNAKGQKNYRSGKAFHIKRPWAEDSTGRRVWCRLHIDPDTNLMTITLPKKFYDTATWPVLIDPTFGYETQGGTNSAALNRGFGFGNVAEQHVATAGDNVTSFHMFTRNNGDTADCGVYDKNGGGNGGALLLAGNVTLTAQSGGAQWITQAADIDLVGGNTHFIAMITGNGIRRYFDDGQPSGSSTEDQIADTTLNSSWVESSTDVELMSFYVTYTAGSSGVTGTATPTQGDDTSSATGLVGDPVTGTATPTQEAQTSSASGIVGDPVTGTATPTQDDDTSTATGFVGNPVTGTATPTQDDDVGASVGQVGLNITGTATPTQDDDVSAASGLVGDNITGTSAVVQDDDTSSASGVVGDSVVGTATPTQADDTSSSTGFVGTNVTGTSAASQEPHTSSATGLVGDAVVGTATPTQDDDTSSATGIVGDGVAGSAAVTQEDDTSSASGTVQGSVSGSAATTQEGDTAVASGVVAPHITGVGSATQEDQTAAASGLVLVFVTGSAAASQEAQISNAVGTVAPHIVGSVSVVQGLQVLTALGQVGEIEEGIGIRDGVTLPDYFDQGKPYVALGILAVDSVSGISYIDQGFPYSANGRMSVDIGGVVSYIETGGIPFTSAGRVAMGTGGVDHISAGLGYTASDQLSIINS